MWNLLIPLAGAAIGAIGQGMQAKAASKPGRTDFKGLVRDAEAAGFNPLTALRATGAAAYSSRPHSAMGAGLGALGAGISQIQFDPVGEQMREKQMSLLDAQIANMTADTHRIKMMGSGNSSPGYAGSSGGNTIKIAGLDVERNKQFADADLISERYGELGEWLYGPIVIGADIGNNLAKGWESLPTAKQKGIKGGNGLKKLLEITVDGGNPALSW